MGAQHPGHRGRRRGARLTTETVAHAIEAHTLFITPGTNMVRRIAFFLAGLVERTARQANRNHLHVSWLWKPGLYLGA